MRILLKSNDLILKSADIDLANNVLDYYLRNKQFLEEFEPKREKEFFTLEHQQYILQKEKEQSDKKEAFRFYISIKTNPDEIIGIIGLNNIVWGCFCSCFVGYKLDVKQINNGYMTQAINAITQFAFEEIHLHRIEGNVMPKNKPSLRVLEKCGFKNEGISEKYLKINGKWEDHIHMVKINHNI